MIKTGFTRPPQPKNVDEFVSGAAKHVRADQAEKLVRVNIQITEHQHEVLRRLAFDRRVSQAELTREAITEWLVGQK